MLFSLLFLSLLPSGGDAHTPITTKILFNREVIRTLQENCLGCHRPGGIAMSLATYEEARPWAKAIRDELLERRMPPWFAVAGYGEFRNAPRLTQRDVDAIVNWVEGGAPKGDAKELPAGLPIPDGWPLGPPDRVLAPAEAHAVPAEGDEHAELELPTGLPGMRWLRALDLRPGNASVVHCATFSIDGGGLVGTWVPGQRTAAWPEGVAVRLPPGARLRVRLHYRGAGQPVLDRSSVGLYLDKAASPREVHELVLGAPRSSVRLERTLDALAIVPRGDPGLVSVQVTAYAPDGTTQVLLWAREPRDDWRPTYFFKAPVRLPRGTRIEAIAYCRDSDAEPAAPPLGPLLTLYYADAALKAGRAGGP